MPNSDSINKKQLSFRQFFFLTLAQAGGAAIIYLPGINEAGRDLWISNIIASIMGYLVIYSHYLPLSLYPEYSMTQVMNKCWGRIIGGIVSLYYLIYFFILCNLIIADIYYFGRISMPETPGYVFIIFFLVPAIYAIKLGIETLARLSEFLLPILIVTYTLLFILVIPKLQFTNLLPIMSEGFKPVVAGAIPNMSFPYAQILPIVFFYKYSDTGTSNNKKFLIYCFGAIFVSTLLLSMRTISSIAAFDENTLKVLTYPPFSTIRIIELGGVLERLDALLLAVFYGTTFYKFVLTYYVTSQIVTDYFNIGEIRDYALPIAVLMGVSMPYLVPRLDVVNESTLPFFILSLPLLVPIPLLLYLTIRLKANKRN